jgi:hypothetical protein
MILLIRLTKVHYEDKGDSPQRHRGHGEDTRPEREKQFKRAVFCPLLIYSLFLWSCVFSVSSVPLW